MFVIDVVWCLISFILGIVTAVRQSQASKLVILNGAFASASFFAFVCFILYLVHGILIFKKIRELKSNS